VRNMFVRPFFVQTTWELEGPHGGRYFFLDVWECSSQIWV
jgi:hypothetical protein